MEPPIQLQPPQLSQLPGPADRQVENPRTISTAWIRGTLWHMWQSCHLKRSCLSTCSCNCTTSLLLLAFLPLNYHLVGETAKIGIFPTLGSTFLSASPKSARLARFSTAFSTKPPAASTLGQIPKLRALASKGFDRLILPVAHGRQLLSPLKTTVSPCFGSLDSFFQRDVLRNEQTCNDVTQRSIMVSFSTSWHLEVQEA